MKIQWEWKDFSELTNPEVLYQILQLREKVFAVEQNCVYTDIDGKDPQAMHLLGWMENKESSLVLAAYARLFFPSKEQDSLTFGRVVVDPNFRQGGLGNRLMEQLLNCIDHSAHAKKSIVISAQHYLVKFYEKFGFQTMGETYNDGGILHVDMVRGGYLKDLEARAACPHSQGTRAIRGRHRKRKKSYAKPATMVSAA